MYIHIYGWVFPKIRVPQNPSYHPYIDGILTYVNHPAIVVALGSPSKNRWTTILPSICV